MLDGNLPRGYDRLADKWRRIAREVASGTTITEACRRAKVKRDTYYLYRRVHPLFQAYLQQCFEAASEDIRVWQTRQLVRAVQIVDEALNHPDAYFRYRAAKDVLKGIGAEASCKQDRDAPNPLETRKFVRALTRIADDFSSGPTTAR
jgi:hypothetical protein